MGDARENLCLYAVLILICTAFLIFVFVKIRKEDAQWRILVIGGGVFLVFIVNLYINNYQHYKDLRNDFLELSTIYNNQKYQLVEGNVEVLHLEPQGGHAPGDIIRIDGIEFELSCFSNTFGYNKTIVYGGVLTEGAFATVYYYQPERFSGQNVIILRIDMLEKTTNSIPINPLLPCSRYENDKKITYAS